jgi:hypothetical protein
VADDFPPLELLHLYGDQVHAVLARLEMSHPRVVGLAASGQDLPEMVPVEMLVDVADAHERAAYDLTEPSQAISELIGHRVILVHTRVGLESLLEGEQMVWL